MLFCVRTSAGHLLVLSCDLLLLRPTSEVRFLFLPFRIEVDTAVEKKNILSQSAVSTADVAFILFHHAVCFNSDGKFFFDVGASSLR